MNNEIKEYRIFHVEENLIKDNGTRFGTMEMLQNDFPGENWAIIPVDEVPDNWQDMTIKNRNLVPSLLKIIKQRNQIEDEQKAILIREKRNKLLYEREQYRLYRQYLRDLPEITGFPNIDLLSAQNYMKMTD